MNPKIGFVLVTHDKPAQIQRLTRRLCELYPGAPIVCHHDFSKTSLDGIDFPAHVRFVRPHIVTRWASITCTLAFHAALRLLYSGPDSPDWFVLLSGADYPVRDSGSVLRDLETGGADAYIDHVRVEHPFVPDPNVKYAEYAFHSKQWVPLAYGRYVATPLWVPGISLKRRKAIRIMLAQLRWKILERWLTPFRDHFRCYSGEAWFTANRRAAEVILSSPAIPRLTRHYKRIFCPDESIHQTILCNEPGLRVSPFHFRYIHWRGGHHPKLLGMEDLPRIFASGAHFARKFDWDTGQPVLDAIDEEVDRAAKTS